MKKDDKTNKQAGTQTDRRIEKRLIKREMGENRYLIYSPCFSLPRRHSRGKSFRKKKSTQKGPVQKYNITYDYETEDNTRERGIENEASKKIT